MALVRVLHGLTSLDRQTTQDFVWSFQKYGGQIDFEYVNIHAAKRPREGSRKADLSIITYELLSLRNVGWWPDVEKRLAHWLSRSTRAVIFPQDDYSGSRITERFVLEHGIEAIYTPIERDLERLYPEIQRDVRFETCLTGYTTDFVGADPFDALPALSDRTIDFGNRIRRLPLYFGREARRKSDVSHAVAQAAAQAGFVVDASDQPQDAKLGESWNAFLRNVKFTAGSKGGASIADPVGRVAQRFNRHLTRRGSGEESALEYALNSEHVFGRFEAIGPRFFDAIQAGVCQILPRDSYLDEFQPDVHYVALEPDLSNLTAVVKRMSDITMATDITSAAHATVIASNKYSYRTFCSNFLAREIGVPTGNSSRTFIGSDLQVSLQNLNPEVQSQALTVLRKVLRDRKSSKLIHELRMDGLDGNPVFTELRDIGVTSEFGPNLAETLNDMQQGEYTYLAMHVPTITRP